MSDLKSICAENRKQWASINDLTGEVKALTGRVEAQTAMNGELVKLLRKALAYEFYVILLLIAALIYGAIGKDGLFSVRHAVPIPDGLPDSPATAYQSPIAPPPDNRFHVV